MRTGLLTAAALAAAFALPATSASAQLAPPQGLSAAPAHGDPGRHCRDGRHHGRCGGALAVGYNHYVGGEWALYNNRSWRSDSYNDWWHDRPNRAYPRWVQDQRGGPCSQDRMWWSGGGWRC